MSVQTTNRQWVLVPDPTPLSPNALTLRYSDKGKVPSLTSPTSVLLSIKALALSSREIQIKQGTYTAPHRLARDLVPCGASAGEIVAVGADVEGWAVGDRVIPLGMGGHHHTPDLELSSLKKSLGAARNGCAQDFLIMDCEDLIRVPHHLTWEEAACMPAAATAWACLFGHTPALLPGSTVLIIGTGGVSLAAAQFALASGSSVILLSSSDAKLVAAKSVLDPLLTEASSEDAIRCINYNTCPQWDDRVKQLTLGRGVDCVVEVAGWGTVGRSVRSVKKGGLVAVTGYLSTYGLIPEEIINQDLSKFILFSAASVRGVFTGNRSQAEQMMRFVGRTGLRPVIAETYDFDCLPSAYTALETSQKLGKIVVRVGAEQI